MGWQATGGPWTGGMPGPDPGLSGLPAGFCHGGAWEAAAPSATLAFALEHAAGPEDLYDSAGTDALIGIARQWAAVESWAAAGKLAALRAMIREDKDGQPLLRHRSDLPEGWDDSLTYEISGALAMGPVSAGNLAHLAWTLGTRLAGTGRLLADGTLTMAKAKLIAATFEPLDDDEAARAEALVLGELAGKTYFQVQRLALRAALAVAPDVAERRRTAAEREHARVTVFREESGAVALSGRDLPAAEALAGHANVVARARQYEASGAFPSHSDGNLQALAYLHLLNGVSAREAIAFASSAGPEPPGGPGPDDGHGNDDGTGPEDDVTGPEDDVTSPEDDGDGPGPSGGPGPDDSRGPDDSSGPGAEPPGGPSGKGDGTGPGDGQPGPDEPGDGDGDGGPSGPEDAQAPGPPLAEVTVPLATLHNAERAGDSRLLGSLDPALARDLAAAAARSPASRWELTIVDEHGYAIGHGLARPARRSSQEPPTGPARRARPQPPPARLASCALPARVNITITQTLLHQLQAQAAQPRPGAPPGGWQLIPSKPGTWTLTLPGGQRLTVRFDVVPVHACDHRYRVNSYLPGDRLRRLVQVRDHTCTWPPCSRPARESDFEHAVPYDKGGVTCSCNAGARSRRCHQVKQLPGWTVTQPRPGWHTWTTPTSRSYSQEPWRYTA